MASLADKLSTRRLNGPEQEPVILHRRRIYILPTAYGGLFVILLAMMLIGSINYNNSLGFALTFLMASVSLISMLHAHRNLSGLQVRSATTESVFSGQVIRFPVVLTNPHANDKLSIRLSAKNFSPVYVTVPAASTVTTQLQCDADKRGRKTLGRIKISCEYPLGLFVAWSWIHLDAQAIVYPRPEENAPPADFEQDGSDQQQNRQRGHDDFSGLRHYQVGDSLNRIAWKQSARGTGLHTKDFTGSGGLTRWLDWHAAETTSLEQRLSRLCQWVLQCEASGNDYGLRLPGFTQAPGHGHKHRHICLTALALFNQSGQ